MERVTGRGGVGYNKRARSHAEPDFLLQWGNRKRLRCVKIQKRDDSIEKTRVRFDSTLVGADQEVPILRRRPSPYRILRKSEEEGRGGMKRQQRNGGDRGMSPEGAQAQAQVQQMNGGSGGGGGGGGSSSGSEVTVWPNLSIALTKEEKEEDFLVFRGSTKLPNRPKKRAKYMQRTLNMVTPGTWLCDLTQERYEVREKKVSKKAPRGLKAMENMENDSD